MVWDSRISTSYLPALQGKAACEMWVVTDYNEVLKEKEKGEPCKRCLQGRVLFMPVVCNSHGGLGRRAYEWLREAFQRKMDGATDTSAKFSVRLELETSLAEISCAVLVRNSMIMAANARDESSASVDLELHDQVDGECGDVMMHDV